MKVGDCVAGASLHRVPVAWLFFAARKVDFEVYNSGHDGFLSLPAATANTDLDGLPFDQN